MAFSTGTVLANSQVNGGTGRLPGGLSIVKTVGTVNNNVPAAKQQAQQISQSVMSQPKGSKTSVTITNGGSGTENFILFDSNSVAARSGASATGADVTFSSTFAGLNNANGYLSLKGAIGQGLRMGTAGCIVTFSDTPDIALSGLTVWNGNYSNYNKQVLNDDLTIAQNIYANSPNILVLEIQAWVNPFFAITGSIPAGHYISFLFNIAGHGGW